MKISSKYLEIAMASACMTTKELSVKANLNYSTLTRIKIGMSTQPATVGKIAKALNVPVTDIIEKDAATSKATT